MKPVRVISMTSRPALLLWIAPLVAALAACQTTPRADPPPLPADWHAPTPASKAAPLQVPHDQAWWLDFGDPMLARMIDAALARNGELASATVRIRNAQLRVGTATRALFPSVSGSAGGSASRTPVPPGQSAPGSWQRSYSASAGVSWELDLWGRLRDTRSVAQWEAQATGDDRDAFALSLSGNVARQYWQIAALQARIDRADQSLALAERTLRMMRVQYEAGAISGLDLAQVEQSLLGQQASRQTLQQQLLEAGNTYSLLFDLPPPQLPAGLAVDTVQAQQARIPAVPAGTPADVLLRRPDLRAAHLRLESTLLNVRIVRKSFLPGISLTGNVATGGNTVKDILANPTRSLGVGLSLPFLDVGEMIRQPQIASNDYEIAVHGYRQSVYRALADVENALTALDAQQRQVRLQEQALATARRVERMNEVRYRAGASQLRFWLDAQEALRQAELALIDARFGALQAAADLNLALGGYVPTTQANQ